MNKRVYLCFDCKYWLRLKNFGKLAPYCTASGVKVWQRSPLTRCNNHIPIKVRA